MTDSESIDSLPKKEEEKKKKPKKLRGKDNETKKKNLLKRKKTFIGKPSPQAPEEKKQRKRGVGP